LGSFNNGLRIIIAGRARLEQKKSGKAVSENDLPLQPIFSDSLVFR
jgi:hypothetical protein